MAEEGTFLGEVQRGWQRFWRLSWWIKGPVFGVIALLVLGGVGAAIGGGDDESDDGEATRLGASRSAEASESPTAKASQTERPTSTPTRVTTRQPTRTPEPTSAGPATTFGSGTHIIGTDIAPGTYRNSGSSGGCYWERLSGFGGTLDEVLANNFTEYLQIVTTEPTDAGFTSGDCGTWAPLARPITSSPTAPFSDGMYVVGTDIAPGTWRNEASEGCYWERLSGFGGEFDDIVTNEFSDSQQVVTISAADVGFQSSDCGTWTKIG